MENVRDIQIDSGFVQDNSIAQKLKKQKTRVKRKKHTKLKHRILFFNVCMSVVLFILIQVSYTDMVNISSDNLIIKSENDKLLVEVNNLNEHILPLVSEQRIAKIAKSRLNMIVPSKENIVEIAINEDLNFVDLDKEFADENFKEKKSILSAITNMFR